MCIRDSRKIFEAMFLLEDMREIFRNALPTGLNEAQENEFQEYLERLQQVLDELKAGKGTPLKFITDRIELRAREEEFININPIQPGGRPQKRGKRSSLTATATQSATIASHPSSWKKSGDHQ